MKQLTLYYFPGCPYCRKVLNFCEENNITLTLKNIQETSKIRDELRHIGGKTQVPCLVIDGKPLYESDDIISWLEVNIGK